MLTQYEQSYNERTKTESKQLIRELVYHYLDNEPAPGIAWEYEQAKKFLSGITLKEVNDASSKWVTDGNNCVVVVTAPEKEGVNLLTEAEVKTAYKNDKNR